MHHSLPTGSPPPAAAPRRRPRLTRTRVIVATLLLAVTTLAGTAPRAEADEVLPELACTVNFQFNFTPALTLTNTTADVTVSSGFVNCLSPSGNHPDLESAAATGTATAESLAGVPCSLLLTVEGTADFTWNTGATSEVSFVVNTNPLAGTITLEGEVTGGTLEGTTGVAVPVLANPNPDCLLVGLTSLTSALSEVVFLPE